MNTEDRPIIFGEVLFDRFPDAARLGGAPFNVAWHLAGFGLRPHFISRVGNDTAGDEVLAKMEAWGMDVSGVQIDSKYPTGAVDIEMHEANHTFDIKANQAYDFIDLNTATTTLPKNTSLLYHGSLALRNDASQQSLVSLRERLDLPTFVDVNVRHPWWNENIVDITLKGATWTKLNESELDLLSNGNGSRAEQAEELIKQLNCESLFLTKGADGAAIIDQTGAIEYKPTTPVTVADTVGAGDAFAAVAILGISHDWNNKQTLLRAMQFAEKICGVQGALLTKITQYEELFSEWK